MIIVLRMTVIIIAIIMMIRIIKVITIIIMTLVYNYFIASKQDSF